MSGKFRILSLPGAMLALVLALAASCSRGESSVRFLVGTYTDGNASAGVYLFAFDGSDAGFSLLDTARAGNPSFIIPSADGRFAWSVGEFWDGRQCVYSYRLAGSGVDVMNRVPTGDGDVGSAPCNAVAAGGRLFTSNYGDGTMSSFPINEDGTLGRCDGRFIPEDASGRSAHLHCATLSPDGRYLFANDLGLDAVYRFDLAAARHPLDAASVTYEFDADGHPGPRHSVFSADGRFLYLIHELGDSLSVFSYADGTLRHVQTVLAYSGGGHGSADIHLSPDGRFLYASHRLREDGISIFSVDRESGRVEAAGYCPTGRHPRNFAISPDGRYLLCACRDDNRIDIYRIDTSDGSLSFTGKSIGVPAPVCIQFFRAPRR